MIKKFDEFINENIFDGIGKRLKGDVLRKEDETTNIKKIKPVDIGTSVLWADDDLQIEGDYLFSFDELEEILPKLNGWRLPTLKEVAELDKIKGERVNDKEIHIGELVFITRGLYRYHSHSHCDDYYYYGWTSDPYDNGSKHIFTSNSDARMLHSPVYDKRVVDQRIQDNRDKLCARLVKDK